MSVIVDTYRSIKDRIIELASSYSPLRNYGAFGRGGYRNISTGTGTDSDKMRMAEVIPTRIENRAFYEVAVTEFWQLGKLINVIAEDMTLRWRDFETGDNPDDSRIMQEQENIFGLQEKTRELIEQARTYGTAIMIIVTGEDVMEMPLSMDTFRPGDLKNLIVVDRFDLTVEGYVTNTWDPNFGKPEFYVWHAGDLGTRMIHHSRVLRYDAIGVGPRYGHNYSSYDTDWGVSVIVPAILEVFRDEDMAASIQSQVLRAGTVAISSTTIDKMTGEFGGGKDISSVLRDIEKGIRSHRMIALSADANVQFLSPNLSNIAQIMQTAQGRMAAAFDIPQSRLWGSPPKGLNASNDSDLSRYSDKIGAMQKAKLSPLLDYLDVILALNAGMDPNKIPKYNWLPYLLSDEKVIAETTEIKAKAVSLLVQNRMYTEDEARAALDGDPILGELEPWDGDSPFPDPEEMMPIPKQSTDKPKQKQRFP